MRTLLLSVVRDLLTVLKNKKLEEAGAGAVVLKSVFEEQISMQAGSMQGYGSPEADDYLGAYVRSHALNEHINLIEETKKYVIFLL